MIATDSNQRLAKGERCPNCGKVAAPPPSAPWAGVPPHIPARCRQGLSSFDAGSVTGRRAPHPECKRCMGTGTYTDPRQFGSHEFTCGCTLTGQPQPEKTYR